MLEQGNDAKGYNWFFFKGAFNNSSKPFEKEIGPTVYPQRAAEGSELKREKAGAWLSPPEPLFLVLPQFLKSVRWAGIPSSLEGGSKQDKAGKHTQTRHTAAESEAWPTLRTGRSLEHTDPDPGPCSFSSADQGEAKGSCHSRDILHFSSQLFQ